MQKLMLLVAMLIVLIGCTPSPQYYDTQGSHKYYQSSITQKVCLGNFEYWRLPSGTGIGMAPVFDSETTEPTLVRCRDK